MRRIEEEWARFVPLESGGDRRSKLAGKYDTSSRCGPGDVVGRYLNGYRNAASESEPVRPFKHQLYASRLKSHGVFGYPPREG